MKIAVEDGQPRGQRHDSPDDSPLFPKASSRLGHQQVTHPELEDASILLSEILIQGNNTTQDVLVQSQSLQSSQEPAVS